MADGGNEDVDNDGGCNGEDLCLGYDANDVEWRLRWLGPGPAGQQQ